MKFELIKPVEVQSGGDILVSLPAGTYKIFNPDYILHKTLLKGIYEARVVNIQNPFDEPAVTLYDRLEIIEFTRDDSATRNLYYFTHLPMYGFVGIIKTHSALRVPTVIDGSYNI